MCWDIIVIGAGPAGLMAAGMAAARGARVLLMERMERPARKLCITGKGRCNITNLRPGEEFLAHVRANREFFAPAFEAFDPLRTEAFFRSIGLEVVRERGERLFPASGRARDVADALVAWCRRQGVEIACGERVRQITASAGKVTGVVTDRPIAARRVILCTGGVSYPLTGSTGDGYGMAHRLGHRIEPLRPSLVALQSTHPAVKALQGVTLRNINVCLLIDGEPAGEEFGELDFARSRTTGNAEIGGPVILRLSRQAVDALIDGRTAEIAIDLKPALSHRQLVDRIGRETAAAPGIALDGLMRKLAPKELAAALARELRRAGKHDAESIALMLKNFRLPVSDYAPFEEAVVTAGGVDVADVDPKSLQSRRVEGLYFAGEVLDLDADTGGYNLQIAFSTGYLAGMSAGQPLERPSGRGAFRPADSEG